MDISVTASAAPAAVSAAAHVMHALHALVSAAGQGGAAAPAVAGVSVDPLHALIATLIGLALSQTAQAAIEHNLATKAWMPQDLKPYLPMLVSAAVGALATRFGVSAADATTGALSLTMFTHAVNSSATLASVGKDPTPEDLAAKAAVKAQVKVQSGDPRR